jgi:hypothetical protein
MILVSAVVTTVVENATIMATSVSTARAEAEAFPFNFLPSAHLHLQHAIDSLIFEYPFSLMTFGILSLPARSGLDSHAKKRPAAPLQASA